MSISQVFVAVAVMLVTAPSAVAQALRAENLMTGPIRITNKGGAGGTIGLADFARAKGDKESLMVMGLVMVGAILTNKSAVNLDAVMPVSPLLAGAAYAQFPKSENHRTGTVLKNVGLVK